MDRKELKRIIQQEIARVREDLLVAPEEVPDDFVKLYTPSDMSNSTCDDCDGCSSCDSSHSHADAPEKRYRLSCSTCGSVMAMQEGCGCSSPSMLLGTHDSFQSEHEFGTEHHEGAYMAKAQLHKIEKYSSKIQHMIPPGHDLEDWMRTKISQAADDLGEVYHKLEYMHHKD